MHNKKLDGLRGLAALNVTISHFIAAFFPALLNANYPQTFPANNNPSILFKIVSFPAISVLYNGNFAVLIFFAISGYVLTNR